MTTDSYLEREFAGVDNYGRPKKTYLEQLATLSDEELDRETYQIIYQAARCANNPRADWHWQATACYHEAKRRGGIEVPIYQQAFKRCYADHAS